MSLAVLGFKLISSSSPFADSSFSCFPCICIHVSGSSPFKPRSVSPPGFDLLWGIWILLYFAFSVFLFFVFVFVFL